MNLETRHSFDIAIALEVGVKKAILLKKVLSWCQNNRDNKRNFHDGHYWTYNTAEAYAAKFPYFNPKSISRWMNELVRDGWMFKGQYAPKKYDKTLSHRVNRDKYRKALETFISQNEESISQNEEPITSNIYTPLVGKKKETFIPPTEKEVKKLMLAALEKLNKTVTADEWADWETEKFIEYWEGENWKRKGKVMKSIARSVTTWIKNGAEKAKYTKPAPNSASYGEKAPIRDERPDIELSEAWEASYQKFTTMFYEGLGEYRTKKVRTLSRQEYVDWTTWKRRPVARRVFNGRANWFCEYAIKWAKKVGVKASSYRLQHELKTTDALLNEVVDYYMKEFGMVGEFVEAA
jgi:hypothetical protein